MGKRKGLWKVNTEQLKKWLPNAYYYLFYGALGSLFPFLNLYYRSLGLNPWHIGILGGLRPIVALFSGPFWCYVSNRYKIRKFVLLASLISWVSFTLPIAFVDHAYYAQCPSTGNSPLNLTSLNDTHLAKNKKREFSASTTKMDANLDLEMDGFRLKPFNANNSQTDEHFINFQQRVLEWRKRIRRGTEESEMQMSREKVPRLVDLGKPFVNSYSLSGMSLNKNPYKELKKPYDFKSRGHPYVNKRVNPFATTIFIEILFFVLIGEVVQAPTDDINIHYDGTFLEPLGVLYQNVPKNSLCSSLGIGLVAFSTGVFLKLAPKYIICGDEYSDYRIAFSVFGILMTSALLLSSMFSFTYRRKKVSFEVRESLKELCALHHVSFVTIVLLMGMFRGALFNFLYWNIAEIDGSEVVVGVTVICQYASDSIMALSAPILMKYIGYIGMIFCGLASYSLRFLIYSWLSTPDSAWVVPSVELLQGVSHSTAWSAFVLYIINYTPRSTYPVGIFIVQGLYLGIGSGFGAMVCGGLIEALDTNVTFRILGLVSLVAGLVFTMTQPTGIDEALPGEIDAISYYADEDGYSSMSEEELLFDYNKRNIIYLPPKDGEEEGIIQTKKVVLPSTNAPLVPTIMSFVTRKQNEPYTR